MGARPTRGSRSIDAGTVWRVLQSWTGSSGSIDRDIYGKLELVRNRSRDLSYNNDYMRKFMSLCRTNIVGPHGFSLQVRAQFPDGKQDKSGNDAVEMAFWSWSKRGTCELSRKFSFTQLCHLIVMAVARDGEALVRKSFAGNDYRFALQLLDIDRLDTAKNEELPDGRVIKMGVELSRAGEPIAYHLRTRHPGDIHPYSYRMSDTERVPASDIYHLGIFERPEQTRCLPWAVSAILRLEHLGAYDEAAVIAARFGAAKMAYWKQGEAGAASFGDDDGGGTGGDGQLTTDFEPGEIKIAPPGAELVTADWQYPHEQYDPFTRACVRGISSGIGVAYSSLSNDLTQVNFASSRSGIIDERDSWMTIQGWLVESFLQPMFADWLRMALLSGQVKTANGGTVTSDKFIKFNVPDWHGRRWQWVDPKKDIEAAVMAVDNGLRTRRSIMAEQGMDLDEVWADLAAEQQMAKQFGLVLGTKPNGASNGQGKDGTEDPVND